MVLAPIVNSLETINAEAASSINAAFVELHSLFGFWPIVLAPNGGARTKAQCDALGTPWNLSDHYEAAVGRAAVDIDNHRTFRNKDEALFLSTMAKHGWYNMQINGSPFPREPWHFASHSLTPADSGSSPLNNQEADMPTNYNSGGTIFTLAPSWAVVHQAQDFFYGSCMAAFGPWVTVNLTPDQLTTIVNFINAQGAAYSKVSAVGSPPLDQAALVAAIVAALVPKIPTKFNLSGETVAA